MKTKIMTYFGHALRIFLAVGFMATVTSCGAIKKFPATVAGKTLYYGVSALRNPIGTTLSITTGAAAGFAAASVRHSDKEDVKEVDASEEVKE